MEFDAWIGPLLILFGVAGLAHFCVFVRMGSNKDWQEHFLRRTGYRWWGLLYILFMVVALALPLTGRVGRGELTTTVLFGFGLSVAAIGVYTGRFIERGLRDGRLSEPSSHRKERGA